MRKVLYAFAALLILAACDNKQFSTPAEEGKDVTKEVAFEIAKNYFFKNDQAIPTSPKITTEEDFEKLFGMATTMGEDGKPTEIDFTKKFVLAIVLPVTDIEPATSLLSEETLRTYRPYGSPLPSPYTY